MLKSVKWLWPASNNDSEFFQKSGQQQVQATQNWKDGGDFDRAESLAKDTAIKILQYKPSCN